MTTPHLAAGTKVPEGAAARQSRRNQPDAGVLLMTRLRDQFSNKRAFEITGSGNS